MALTKVNIDNTKHYTWGDNCDSWILAENNQLSIKEEQMPAGTSEQWHYHKNVQQFFYILKGKAVMEVEEKNIELNENEGVHIAAGAKHRIINNTTVPLQFLIISQPAVNADRININE